MNTENNANFCLEARLNNIIVSTSAPIKTTNLGGCIVAAIYTEKEMMKSIALTHYAPFSTTEHIRQLALYLEESQFAYQKAVLFFKRPDSNVHSLVGLLKQYCTNEVVLVQYSGYHEEVKVDLQNKHWKTKMKEGLF